LLSTMTAEPTTAERTVHLKFLEGERELTERELLENDITRYQATKFYTDHIRNSGYYEQLKYIVEPSVREFTSPGELDTSGEHENTVVHGLQHKYPQTGLLLVTDRCASSCRYCFRKRIVGRDAGEVAPDFAAVGEYIGRHPEMTNVLLSGGDPFVLSTPKLHAIMDHLLPCTSLRSIRFGTKTIAFHPKRFADPELPALFARIMDAGKMPVIVAHFDHFAEISDEARRNIAALRAVGVQFLNQSVLLGRVNDDADTIARTFAELHSIGVRPYYLFQARPVKGASHFQVPLKRGAAIARGAAARLSGIEKTFKYIMSHQTGKIEILDVDDDDRVYLRYHQNKDRERIGVVFTRHFVNDACWLDDLAVA
jgi:lysine 2,3-aminomutase